MHKTKFIFILLLISCCSLLQATSAKDQKIDSTLTDFTQEDLIKQEDEQTKLENLIKATEASLGRQKKLRSLLDEYRKTEANCIARPKDTELLLKLAKSGQELYDAIMESYLSDYFSQEFIAELEKLKTIASKKSIAPVR